MEYALRVADAESPFADPRSVCPPALRPLLPPGPWTAVYFGSEFCADRLPSAREANVLCSRCRQHGLEAVLLTPVVTAEGLARVGTLLEDLAASGWTPSVIYNDWGVLDLLRSDHPDLPRRMGRLMNRGLRDPRLLAAPGAFAPNPSRGRALRRLAVRLGACAVESDADLEPGYLGPGDEGLERTLHLPFTFVTTGRNCLEKACLGAGEDAGFVKDLGRPCPRPCGREPRREPREDCERPLWRAGNTLFYETPAALAEHHLALADRVVVHERALP